jgi:hypothetical protein
MTSYNAHSRDINLKLSQAKTLKRCLTVQLFTQAVHTESLFVDNSKTVGLLQIPLPLFLHI